MKYQTHKHLQVHTGVTMGAYTGTQTYSYVDTRGFDEALVIATLGTMGSTADCTVTVEESPSTTAGSFATITGASFGEKTSTTDAAIYHGRINLRPRKRYIRAKATCSAGTVVQVGVCIILASPASLPVTQGTTTSFNV
jgi:hypothetical protein